MTSTWVRIQDESHGTESLLDPERMSYDMVMSDRSARRGVSVCTDLDALMDYYIERPIEIGDRPVIVTLEGDETGDTPLDEEQGEHLIYPTRIVSIADAEAAGFFDGINARLGE